MSRQAHMRTDKAAGMQQNNPIRAQEHTQNTHMRVVASAERVCPIIRAARDAARRVEAASGGMVPPYPGAQQIKRSCSHAKLAGLQTLAGNGGSNGSNGAGNGGGNGGFGNSGGNGRAGVACGGGSSAAGMAGSNSERTSSGGQASSSVSATAAVVDVSVWGEGSTDLRADLSGPWMISGAGGGPASVLLMLSLLGMHTRIDAG
eukprot:scaffold264629_cov17-Tisochrysis_lutea.AAC.2